MPHKHTTNEKMTPLNVWYQLEDPGGRTIGSVDQGFCPEDSNLVALRGLIRARNPNTLGRFDASQLAIHLHDDVNPLELDALVSSFPTSEEEPLVVKIIDSNWSTITDKNSKAMMNEMMESMMRKFFQLHLESKETSRTSFTTVTTAEIGSKCITLSSPFFISNNEDMKIQRHFVFDEDDYKVLAKEQEAQIQKLVVEHLDRLSAGGSLFVRDTHASFPHFPRSLRPDVTLFRRSSIGDKDSTAIAIDGCLQDVVSVFEVKRFNSNLDDHETLGQIISYLNSLHAHTLHQHRPQMFGAIINIRSIRFVCYDHYTQTTSCTPIYDLARFTSNSNSNSVEATEGYQYLRAFMSQDVKVLGWRAIVSDTLARSFSITGLLGEGAFSHVYSAKNIQSNDENIIIKCYKSNNHISAKDSKVTEVDILKVIQSIAGKYLLPTIIDDTSETELVLAPRGYTIGTERPPTASFFIELVNIIKAGHELELIHRDIRPSNIVETSTRQPILIDFGCAVKSGCSFPYAGTTRYASQRILRELIKNRTNIDARIEDDISSMIKCFIFFRMDVMQYFEFQSIHKTDYIGIFNFWESLLSRPLFAPFLKLDERDPHESLKSLLAKW